MAARHADHSRYDRERDRYAAPRRDERGGNRDRRDDRREDRRDDRSDRYGGGRVRDDRRGGGGRDDRRDRDHRRSRSPVRRHDTYRRDDRRDDRHEDRREDRRGDRRDDRERRRRSTSRRSGPTATDSRRGSTDVALVTKKDPAQVQQEKLAKLAEWKKRKADGLTKDKPDTPAADASPAAAPSTPASEAKPEPVKTKTSQKSAADKGKQKSTFKLDESAAARPLLTKPAGVAVIASAASMSSRPLIPPTALLTSAGRAAEATAKSNIGTFGLKTKAVTEEETSTKASILDDGAANKRMFTALPTVTDTDEVMPLADDDDDVSMGDLGSDDDAANAEAKTQLEKRREAMHMEEARVNEAREDRDMDMDAEEVDALDAFMAGLDDSEQQRPLAPDMTMLNEELEPELTAVGEDDPFAIHTVKKKKKEIPVPDHSKIDYEPFRRNFYIQAKEVSEMTPDQVADLRHTLDGIVVKPEDVADVIRPVMKWAQMGLLNATLNVITEHGFETPTAIQAQAIPVIESGSDLIAVAKTGSGKTLAFGIPMIRHILDQPPLKPSDGPIGLILAPTRELSIQIVSELKPFLSASKMVIKAAYGGQSIGDNINMLKRGGVHILCATAGRLIDLLASNQGRVLNFRRITYVVLDEADRMFDMGFEPQVMKILACVRPDRQTVMFSATMPRNVQSLAAKALSKAATITIGGRSKVAAEITQIVKIVANSYEQKVHQLMLDLGRIFAEDENSQVLIFTERQERAEDLLAKLFKGQYYATNTIHGAKDQTDRNEAIMEFKQGILNILIATSVAARGLDVPGLAVVYNFDCPTHLEDYVHRCGRTGRAGNTGTAITLIENPGQDRFAVHVAHALKDSGVEVPDDLLKMAETFNEKVKAGEEKYYGGFGGKGLDRLNNARDLDKTREKRAFRLEGENQSEADLDLAALKLKLLPKAGKAGTAGTEEPEPAWKKLLNGKIVVNKTETAVAATSGKPLTAKEKAVLAAKKIDGNLSKKGTIRKFIIPSLVRGHEVLPRPWYPREAAMSTSFYECFTNSDF
jgi:ATP-dependent RNA helicase DDX46/PRP5